MYDEPHDDDRDFWRDEPTRSLRRISHDRTRQHTAVVPVTPAAPGRSVAFASSTFAPEPLVERLRRRAEHDPFLARLAVMLGVGALLVPAAFSLRDSEPVLLGSAPVGAPTAVVVQPVAEPESVVVAAPSASAVALAATLPALDGPAPQAEAVQAAVAQAEAVEVAAVEVAAEPVAAAEPVVAAGAAGSAPAGLAVAQAAQPASVESKPVCSKSYKVVAGDYWIRIAKRAGVTTKQLLAANNATAKTPLYPGRTICLPKNATVPTPAAPTPTTTPTTVKPPTTTAPKNGAGAKPAAPATTAPPVTVPARSYSAAEVEAIIREVWPDDLEDEAVRIARRESNLQPTAKNYCCIGLFQLYWSVHKSWLAQIGVTSSAQLMDPQVNATAALTLYNRAGGWGPWT